MTQNYSTRRPRAIAIAFFLEQRIIAGIKENAPSRSSRQKVERD
jgi:hypothetical protein